MEDGADDFLEALIQRSLACNELGDRAAALSFAARALHFVVPRPPVLRAVVDTAVDYDCETYTPPKPGDDLAFGLSASPVAHLAAATAENLPLTARYLREAVIRRLEWNALDERALVLGLHPSALAYREGSLPVDSEFWGQRASENRQVLAPYVARQKDCYSWVASKLVEEGRMTVAQ